MFKELVSLKLLIMDYKQSKSIISKIMYILLKRDIKKILNNIKTLKGTFDIILQFCIFYNATQIKFDKYYIQINYFDNSEMVYNIFIFNKEIKEHIHLYRDKQILIRHTTINGDKEISYDIEYNEEIIDNRTILLEVIRQYTIQYIEEVL